MASRIERLRARYPRLLVWLLVAAIVLNLIAHPLLRVRARPVWKHGDGDLVHLIITDDQATARRFGIYAVLGQMSEGATLVVPDGTWVDPYVARNIGGITVDERRYWLYADAEVPPGLRHDGLLELPTGPEGEYLGVLVRWWILPGPDTDTFWLGVRGEDMVIVPDTVAPVPYGGSGG